MENYQEIHELVLKIKKGDEKSFNLVYNLYNKKLFTFAFSMLKNREDAKEILQETFIKIWEERDDLNENRSLKSYIFSIAHNKIIDLFRKRMNEKDYKNNLLSNIEEYNNENNYDLELIEKKKTLIKIVDQLPLSRKNIFTLSKFRGLSHKEIAFKLNISTKTIENQITSSLKFIRNKLQNIELIILLSILFQ